MKIIICQTPKEYYNLQESCDWIACFFCVEQKPKHEIPILRLLVDYNSAKLNGYSTFAATYKWYHKVLPCVENELDIHNLCEQVQLQNLYHTIPVNFRNHAINNIDSKNLVEFRTAYYRNNLCQSCPLFNQNICMACGCNVHEKILDANESCPDNPPKWYNVKASEATQITQIKEKDCGCKKTKLG